MNGANCSERPLKLEPKLSKTQRKTNLQLLETRLALAISIISLISLIPIISLASIVPSLFDQPGDDDPIPTGSWRRRKTRFKPQVHLCWSFSNEDLCVIMIEFLCFFPSC